jgi:[ribosomal protein S5]-alanine N-acetyltransferase
MDDIPGLKGEKVRLVPVDKAMHLENAMKWFNDPEVVQYLILNTGVTRGMEEEWFDRMQKRETAFAWAILDETGRHIGFSEIDNIQWRRRLASTGTLIGDKAAWRKGYGTDSMRVRTHFAFEILGLHRLASGTRTDNIASQRALEKVGYKREGVARKAHFWGGQWYDIALYGILEDDYFSR